MVGTPRQYHHQVAHFLRRTVTYADNGSAKVIGTLPAGALILKPCSGVHVITAFNAGTTNVIDVGYVNATTTDDDYFGTDLALGAATFVPLDEAVGGFRVDVATDVTATVGLSGTAATAGVAEVVIVYIPDSDQ